MRSRAKVASLVFAALGVCIALAGCSADGDSNGPSTAAQPLGSAVPTIDELTAAIEAMANTPHRFEISMFGSSALSAPESDQPSEPQLVVTGEFDGTWSISEMRADVNRDGEETLGMAAITDDATAFFTSPAHAGMPVIPGDPLSPARDGWVRIDLDAVLEVNPDEVSWRSLPNSSLILSGAKDSLTGTGGVGLLETASRGPAERSFEYSYTESVGQEEQPDDMGPTEVTVTIGIDASGAVRTLDVLAETTIVGGRPRASLTQVDLFDLNEPITIVVPGSAVDVTADLVDQFAALG